MPVKKYELKKGDRFGRYTIINNTPAIINKQKKRECQCDCGTIKRVFQTNLVNGSTKSCGCYLRQRLKENPHITNGIWQQGLRFPNIYRHMKGRCADPRYKAYPLYGGRGIKCERETLEDFYNDMHEGYIKHCEEYGEKNTTLDRIDVNGNYCKENCRWATRKEQQYNKRNNITIKIGGEMLGVCDFAKKYNITEDAARERIKRYQNGEKTFEALTHYGPKKKDGMEIKGRFYTYKKLREILGADDNWLWKRIIKYNNGEITDDEMLLTKKEVKDLAKCKRVITINGKIYDSNSLAEEIGVDKQTALRRIKLYKKGEMPDYIVLHKGGLPTRWKTLFKKENNEGPEKA